MSGLHLCTGDIASDFMYVAKVDEEGLAAISARGWNCASSRTL
jgi:hypothetical protein